MMERLETRTVRVPCPFANGKVRDIVVDCAAVGNSFIPLYNGCDYRYACADCDRCVFHVNRILLNNPQTAHGELLDTQREIPQK